MPSLFSYLSDRNFHDMTSIIMQAHSLTTLLELGSETFRKSDFKTFNCPKIAEIFQLLL